MRLLPSSLPTQVLQWWGLLAGPLVWSAQLVIGYGATQAECGAGGSRWQLEHDVWQLTTMSVAAAVALSGLAAAYVAFHASRHSHYSDPPPRGRVRFFAAGGLASSTLALALILLSGLGGTFTWGCGQS